MKTKIKTSSLALLCALSAVVAMPVNAAAPVRTLGGAGTYSSASSASNTSGSTISKPAGATTASTRAGTMRVLPTTVKATASAGSSSGSTSGATVSAGGTRVATSPRLSIGKYLSNKSATISASKKEAEDEMNFAADEKIGNLQARIVDLEKFIGAIGDSGLRQDLDALLTRFDALEDEADLEYAEIDSLAERVAKLESDVVAALMESKAYTDAQIAEITGGTTSSLADLATRVEANKSALDTLNGTGAGSIAQIIANEILRADAAYDKKGAAEAALAEAKQYTDTELDALETSLSGTSTNLTELTQRVDSIENPDTGLLKQAKDYADRSQADAETYADGLADAALKDANTYTDSKVAAVNAVVEQNTQVINQHTETIQQHNTTIEQHTATLAENKEAIASVDTIVKENVEKIESIVQGDVEDKSITAAKLTTGDVALAPGEMAMLVSDGDRGVMWVSYGVAE